MDCDTHLENGHILAGELTLGSIDLGGDVGECDIKIYTEYHTLGKNKEKPYFMVTNNNGFESRISIIENKYNDNDCNILSEEQANILNEWLNKSDRWNSGTNWRHVYGQWRGSNHNSEYYIQTKNKDISDYNNIKEA